MERINVMLQKRPRTAAASCAAAVAALVCITGISVVGTSTGAHAATVCKKVVITSSGRWRSKENAAKAARAKWRYGVVKKFSPVWGLWRYARNKTKTCSKRWYGWKCRYQAIPCRPD